MHKKDWYILIIGILLMGCSQPQQEDHSQTTARCLEEAEAALANDSVRQGETLLRKTIRLAEKSEDWHTYYIAYQRLAETISQSLRDIQKTRIQQVFGTFRQTGNLKKRSGTHSPRDHRCGRVRQLF